MSTGADGFIVVDLPPEASQEFRKHCQEFQMYVSLRALVR
jgi:tryptophan synthase alpha subunit